MWPTALTLFTLGNDGLLWLPPHSEGHTKAGLASFQRGCLTCSLNSSRSVVMHCCSTCLSSRFLREATASPATTDINTLCFFWTHRREKQLTLCFATKASKCMVPNRRPQSHKLNFIISYCPLRFQSPVHFPHMHYSSVHFLLFHVERTQEAM